MSEFRAKMINGAPVIECWSEEIIKPDGTRGVIVHAPSLSVVAKFLEQQDKKEDRDG
jgi:hypothetical protein